MKTYKITARKPKPNNWAASLVPREHQELFCEFIVQGEHPIDATSRLENTYHFHADWTFDEPIELKMMVMQCGGNVIAVGKD